MYLISACLAGFCTRYDGELLEHDSLERAVALVRCGLAIPVCPEQLGGLPTPRKAVFFDIADGEAVLDGKAKTLSEDGEDFTDCLIRGAEETLRIARLYGADTAILKDGSPSCGVSRVNIGGLKTAGVGVTAALLRRHGISVARIDSI